MPMIRVNAKEAAALKLKRARDKAWNNAIGAALETVKRRLKKADALESGLVQAIAHDLRKMIR